MCELFGFSARFPATIELSLQALLQRADVANPDGWGIVYYEQNDAYVLREPRPANSSPLALLMADRGISSPLIMSHIRRATTGDIELQNTHPFTRELRGSLHAFAFNGDVPDLFDTPIESGFCTPMGTTDAERAFCHILHRLSALSDPDWQAVAAVLQQTGDWLAGMGPTNFLYSDSRYLYAYASRRRHNDGEGPPGLHYLTRRCTEQVNVPACGSLKVHSTHGQHQQAILFATVPLSDEPWIPFTEGQLMVARAGHLLQDTGPVTPGL